MAYTTINKSTDYFNTKLYAGNGSTQTISGVGFEPSMTWAKARTTTTNNVLQSTVQGLSTAQFSNLAVAESTGLSNAITAYNSDGFALGDWSPLNASGQNFISWNWKAGTTGSGTTTGAGTGKAYSYSVNTTSGFSVVKYVGNGTAGHTIPHHLGAVPKMLITKNLGRGEHWRVYHSSLGNANKLSLNNITASASATEWNSTTPTSSVFSIGTGEQINYNNDNYIAYCFADVQGFSKFGKYIGNGNSNGSFNYTGFKPAFVMIKSTGSGQGWCMKTAKSNNVINANVNNYFLQANQTNVENTSTDSSFGIDMLSNGFKLRNNDGIMNSSGQNYIYMAYSAAPLVGSNNIPANAR